VCVRAFEGGGGGDELPGRIRKECSRGGVYCLLCVSCVVCLRILLNVLSSQCSLPTPLPHRPENTKRSLKRSPPGTPLPFLFLFFSRGDTQGVEAWERERKEGGWLEGRYVDRGGIEFVFNARVSRQQNKTEKKPKKKTKRNPN